MITLELCKEFWSRFNVLIQDAIIWFGERNELEKAKHTASRYDLFTSSSDSEVTWKARDFFGDENDDLHEFLFIGKLNDEVRTILEGKNIKFVNKGKRDRKIQLVLKANDLMSVSTIPLDILNCKYIEGNYLLNSLNDQKSFALIKLYSDCREKRKNVNCEAVCEPYITINDDNGDLIAIDAIDVAYDEKKSGNTRIYTLPYSDKYINIRASQIAAKIEENMFEEFTLNLDSRAALKRKVLSKLSKKWNLMESRDDREVRKINNSIVDACARFLDMLGVHKRGTKKKEFQTAINIVMAAVTPCSNEISSRAIARRLSVHKDIVCRGRLERNLIEGDTYLSDCEISEDEDTNEDTNSVVENIVVNETTRKSSNEFKSSEEGETDGSFESEDEHEVNDDDDAIILNNSYSDDGSIVVESVAPCDEDDEEYINCIFPEQCRDEIKEYKDSLANSECVKRESLLLKLIRGNVRKTRKDKIELLPVRFFCHKDYSPFRIDTFDTAQVIVQSLCGKYFKYEDVRKKKGTLLQAYKWFTESMDYEVYQQTESNYFESRSKDGESKLKYKAISYRKFCDGICPCVRDIKQYDCSDRLMTDHKNLLNSLLAYTRKPEIKVLLEKCECPLHKKQTLLDFSSQPNFFKSICCPPLVWEGVTISAYETEWTKDDLKAQNLEHCYSQSMESDADGRAVKKSLCTKRVMPEKFKIKKKNLTLGKLIIQHRRCLFNQCTQPCCGLKYFFELEANRCPVLYSSNEEIKTRVELFFTSERENTADQWDHGIFHLTGRQLMEKLYLCNIDLMPHYFNARWETHNRTLLMETFTEEWIVIHTDYSATYPVEKQFTVNCYIAINCVQLVIIVSHSPRWVTLSDGTKKRIFITDSYHYWYHIKDFLTRGTQCVFSCIDRTIFDVRSRGIKFSKVAANSDGCKEQFKNSKAAFLTGAASTRYGVARFVWDFAPTATFKCIVDVAGGVAKRAHNKGMKQHDADSRHARDVAKWLRENQSQPKPVAPELRDLYQIDSYHHFFVVDEKDATEEDKRNRYAVIGKFDEQLLDTKTLQGISELYQLESVPNGEISEPLYKADHLTSGPGAFYLKPFPRESVFAKVRRNVCWGDCCMNGDGSQCASHSITGGYHTKQLHWVQPNLEKLKAKMEARKSAARKAKEARRNKGSTFLDIGDVIEAVFEGKDRWFKGRIKAKNEDGSYHIVYDDEDEETAVPPNLVRAFKQYVVGDKVKAEWSIASMGGNNQWYKATITEIHVHASDDVTYTVKFVKRRNEDAAQVGEVNSSLMARIYTKPRKKGNRVFDDVVSRPNEEKKNDSESENEDFYEFDEEWTF